MSLASGSHEVNARKRVMHACEGAAALPSFDHVLSVTSPDSERNDSTETSRRRNVLVYATRASVDTAIQKQNAATTTVESPNKGSLWVASRQLKFERPPGP